MDNQLAALTDTKKILKTQTAKLLESRDELQLILKQAEEIKKGIDTELFNRCVVGASKSLTIGVPEGRQVKIITVRDFKTVPVEFADKYQATKIVVETKILKALADTGVAVPGISEREQLYVK